MKELTRFTKRNIHTLPPQRVADMLRDERIVKFVCRDYECFLCCADSQVKYSDTIPKTRVHSMSNTALKNIVSEKKIVGVTFRELGVVGLLIDESAMSIGVRRALGKKKKEMVLLDTIESAKILGVSYSSLANARESGLLKGVKAPNYIKLGHKIYRYDEKVLNAWKKKNGLLNKVTE